MTSRELDAAQVALIGQTWELETERGFSHWTCDSVSWTGLRCAVTLNDGRGNYLDLTLTDWSPEGLTAFWQRAAEALATRLEEPVEAGHDWEGR